MNHWGLQVRRELLRLRGYKRLGKFLLLRYCLYKVLAFKERPLLLFAHDLRVEITIHNVFGWYYLSLPIMIRGYLWPLGSDIRGRLWASSDSGLEASLMIESYSSKEWFINGSFVYRFIPSSKLWFVQSITFTLIQYMHLNKISLRFKLLWYKHDLVNERS